MEMRLRLPVGIDSFEKLRKGNYYYVDKTALIEQALEKGSEVTSAFWKIPEYEYAQKLF